MTPRCAVHVRRLRDPASRARGTGPVCHRRTAPAQPPPGPTLPVERPTAGAGQLALEDHMAVNVSLSPASQRLLLEIARHDKRGGAVVKYLSRGRYHLNGGTVAFNRNSFFLLYENQLVTGWDEEDGGPIRLTEEGANLVAKLDAQEAEKKPRSKPSADGSAARRLLLEIAKQESEVLIHSGDRRRVWRLGAHDGYSASIDTWVALEKAGLIRIDFGFAGGRRVSATDAGRQCLT